jgi:uncharacterized protein
MKPTKKIYDSVHGFIRFNELESQLIDALPFQRLQSLHQLGIAYLVYPGATHTRFVHSLGVMELASRIFDKISSRQPIPDDVYWKQIVRLGALCHDMGHLPFSHVAEKALLGEKGHEKWTIRIIESPLLRPIWENMQYPAEQVVEDLIKISTGEGNLTAWERALSHTITGDFFGADRMDYLIRDAQCTGVAYGLFDYHQLLEMLTLLPVQDRWELGIEEDGIESCEALLRARYFMHQRVYQYSSVKAYSFHLSRFMKQFYQDREIASMEQYLSLTDNEILSAIRLSAKNPEDPGHHDALALFTRKSRFKAFAIPEGMAEQDLQEIAQNIPEGMMAWEFSTKKKSNIGLSFPVLKRSGTVVDASRCSEIKLPSSPMSWVYISPEYEYLIYSFHDLVNS